MLKRKLSGRNQSTANGRLGVLAIGGTWDVKTPLGSHVERGTLAKASSGDVDAFRELYDAYGANIYRYGMLQTENRQAAEDILQETMIAVWRSREKLPDIASMSSWIMAIARNKTIDYIREKAPTVSICESGGAWEQDVSSGAVGTAWLKMAGACLPPVETASGLPEEAISDRIDMAAALRELDPTKRELLFMVFYLDMSYSEVADTLGVPVGTVKSRMYYARWQLLEILERGCSSCQDANQQSVCCP